MLIGLSLALSYVLMGVGHVTAVLTVDPPNKPMWAFKPTLGKMVLAGINWPFSLIFNAHFSDPENAAHAAALAALRIALEFAFFAALIWFSIRLAELSTSNLYIEIAVVAACLIALRYMMPLLTLLLMPVLLLLALPLDWLFPKRSR